MLSIARLHFSDNEKKYDEDNDMYSVPSIPQIISYASLVGSMSLMMSHLVSLCNEISVTIFPVATGLALTTMLGSLEPTILRQAQAGRSHMILCHERDSTVGHVRCTGLIAECQRCAPPGVHVYYENISSNSLLSRSMGIVLAWVY